MKILPVFQGALLCFCVSLLFSASVCHGDDNTVEVVGLAECSDCAESKIKTGQAFSGLRVTIDCKPENGEFKTRGVGELDEEGKFKVSLPHDSINDGKMKEECYAQLHSASSAPCPAHNGLESSKIVFKSKTNGIHTFGLAGKLKFSPATCTSAFLLPHYKHPTLPKFPPYSHKPSSFPPLPPKVYEKPPLPQFSHPPLSFPPLPPKVYEKPPLPPFSHPPLSFPPLPPKVFPKKPLPPPFPIYKKPLPPHVPIYKKPLPPHVPIYKKPLPLPVPVYKKPLPPLVPVYKKPFPPHIPIFKKPLPPPFPFFKKPLPPPLPFFKKPLPPPLLKFKKPLHPFPKIPPKYSHHPKFGKWPPLSPSFPHP